LSAKEIENWQEDLRVAAMAVERHDPLEAKQRRSLAYWLTPLPDQENNLGRDATVDELAERLTNEKLGLRLDSSVCRDILIEHGCAEAKTPGKPISRAWFGTDAGQRAWHALESVARSGGDRRK
jgi:hypothetical protein